MLVAAVRQAPGTLGGMETLSPACRLDAQKGKDEKVDD
jgi:hypothetical protein